MMEGSPVNKAHGNDARAYLEQEVAGRAFHRNAEAVRVTCSFARAERLLGREYHGRFLIELLQNAADASREADGSSGRSRVVVRIAKGPALLVANKGSPMNARTVIESLGHIGASTKVEGEAIGHKGIGFKSVLEITRTPEIYSGLRNSVPTLAVGFDPDVAREKIQDATDSWETWLTDVQGLDRSDEYAAVPVLRYPHWIDHLPADVADLKEQGFDTVVRLPFDERFTEHTGLHKDAWLETVRRAVEDVSDQILLLLGCFDEVRLDARLAGGSDTEITQEAQEPPAEIGGGTSREVVRVLRNGQLSSKWRLFRSTLSDRADLAGELAVGIRVDDGTSVEKVLPAVDDQPSSPFHLFFPTLIPSGVPLLLHAYFEVNAARTAFYKGSIPDAEAMLEQLARLAGTAITDAVKAETLDLASLVNLIAEAGEPEDERARSFRAGLLALLDDVEWIPLQRDDGVPQSDRPASVFAERRDLLQKIGRTFSPSYFRLQTRLGFPDDGLSDGALELVAGRHPPDSPDLWKIVEWLCLPGRVPPWQGSSADSGFRSLVDLFAAIDVENHRATQSLLGKLREKPESRIIPTVGPEDSRILLRVPDPDGSARGRRGRLVMARVGSSGGPPLVPPEHLDVAFLPDGLLSSDGEVDRSSVEAIDRARPLGVRPFTVDDVLDRLNLVEATNLDEGQMKQLVDFLWRLLVRARGSALGTKDSAEQAASFDPSKWFWCRPGSVWQDASARPRQLRERYLSAVRLPCRDGGWRQAGSIAFGADWARWLQERGNERLTPSDQTRIAAYEALEQICPGDRALLAPPEVVLGLLDKDAFDGVRSAIDDGREPDRALEEEMLERERHAFLLRLGVWEVPPVGAFQNGTLANRESTSWPAPAVDTQGRLVETDGGWRFGLDGWKGKRHHTVHLAEDYRFLWPLKEMAHRDASALVRCLRLGARLYGERSNSLVFCSGCSDSGGSHSAWRRSSSDDGYLSSLAIQLRSEPWVPCTLAGRLMEEGCRPGSSWWHPKPPTGAGLLQSPWRIVPVCGPDIGVDEGLRRLAEIPVLDDASAGVVERLLLDLREQFEHGGLQEDPQTSSNARQAFIGLHRLAYERLSELPPEAATEVVQRTGVLCEVGGSLEYWTPSEARHDDGSFSTYVRRFSGQVPLVVLPRDRGSIATHLRVARFQLALKRRTQEDGQDVTDDVREFLGDRIHELLAIMVHHSLGAQTLDAQGERFEERARRIRNLQVRQVRDLIIDVSVPDSGLSVTMGEGSTHDLFLEGETSPSPVLYHDFSGDGWEDRLRRKISPYLARVLGNPAYTHTFGEFLGGDEAEREEFLLELGISRDDADAVRARVGIVGEEERMLHQRWFAAILGLTDAGSLDLDGETLTRMLSDNEHLSVETSRRLVELGGGELVRRDAGPEGALRLLWNSGFDLGDLNSRLLDLRDKGLSIRVSRTRFSSWMSENRMRLRAVLETVRSQDAAKEIVESLRVPREFDLALDPGLPELLSPIVEALRREELQADADKLAQVPEQELMRLGQFETVENLHAAVDLLLKPAERARFLSERAALWRGEILLLAVAVLSKVSRQETRANIRALEEQVDRKLPSNPSSPEKLRASVEDLFEPELARRVNGCLQDTLNAPAPHRADLVEWAGISSDHLERVRRVLKEPGGEHARKVNADVEDLRGKGVKPSVPAGLRISSHDNPDGEVKKPSGPKPVRPVKIDESHDQRKRELGDEGERWALAAVIDALIALDDSTRDVALGRIKELLVDQFKGEPVDRALGHFDRARLDDLDTEELIEELSGLLHVSRYSDAFGFDLLGWLPPGPGREAQAVCLEVKSSRDQAFQLSRGEWSLAEKFHQERIGNQYAILVVRRGRSRGVPKSMDLLGDPKRLLDDGLLKREPAGYQMTYMTGSS